MNEQLINEQYQYILRLIGQKRLKEALTQLESFLWKCPEWSLRTRLEQIQTSYSYMLQYMRQGVEDPERRKLYQKLLTDTLEITDQARITLLDSVSNHYYHQYRTRLSEEVSPLTLRELMINCRGTRMALRVINSGNILFSPYRGKKQINEMPNALSQCCSFCSL